MSNHESLSRLLEIEDRARSRVREADEKAQEILAQAREEADRRIERARAEATDEADALRVEVSDGAEKRAQALMADEQTAIEAMAKQTEQNLQDAVGFLEAWVTAREL